MYFSSKAVAGTIFLGITGARIADKPPQEQQYASPESLFSDDEVLRRLGTTEVCTHTRHARMTSCTQFDSGEDQDGEADEAISAVDLHDNASRNADSVDKKSYGTDDSYDVIIVGAGWAGVAAADYLQANNITNFKVIEGRDYIGGRSYTKEKAWKDYDIDMGSMWLLYGSQNPLWESAMKAGINMAPYEYSSKVVSMEEGKTIGAKKFSKLSTQLYDYGFAYYRWGKQNFVDYYDEGLNMSASESLDLISQNAYYQKEDKKIVLQASFQEWLELMYAARTDDMSLWYGIVGEHSYLGGYYADNAEDHLLVGGYTTLVEAVAEPVVDRIQTNSKVTTINYKNGGVKVKYDDRSGSTVTNKVAHAKKIIVTVPHGVLSRRANKGGIKFNPPLSKEVKQSISRIGMGQMIKMFLFWDDEDIFWPNDSEQFMERDGIGSDFRLTFYNPSYNKNVVLPYLFTFMLGDEVEKIAKQFANSNEEKYEKKLTKLVIDPLRNMYGDSIPDPVKVVVTKWTEDEFAYGVYSYNKVGYVKNDRKKLQEPINDKLFLGGECTSTHHYATTHGAYYSGVKAARKVVQSLKTED